MSEAYARAVSHVEQLKKQGVPAIEIQLRFPPFSQGGFTVNRVYSVDPVLVGMYSAGNSMVKFDKSTLEKISQLAKQRGLKVDVSGLNVFFRGKRRAVVAWLKENFFGALESELFEAIGRDIYGLTSDSSQPSHFAIAVEQQTKDNELGTLSEFVDEETEGEEER
ncbi:MAG: hypothetical protein ACE5PO_04320 [Candidatus Bathyarchaeia archaeon]